MPLPAEPSHTAIPSTARSPALRTPCSRCQIFFFPPFARHLFAPNFERPGERRDDLAESWSTPDRLTNIFRLFPGVPFQDGRTLTSADVRATLNFILNAANKSPNRGAFGLLRSSET